MSVYQNDNPAFFEEAINSIVSQSYGIENIRIYLAIDGEVPQEIKDIMEKHKKFFYKVEQIMPNKGLANALNVLIASLEDEEYIFRMDSDDIARENRIQKQVEFMQKNSEIGICGMAIEEFLKNGDKNIRKYPATNEKILANIHKISPFAHPSVCFRKSALQKLEKYPTGYHLCEDIALWFEAAKKEIKMANLSEIGLNFRIQSNFYKRRSLSKALSEFMVYWNGTIELFGINLKLLFPTARLIFRLMPKFVIKLAYNSRLRKKLLNRW
jgi:cellulose synthase/poly-beta-1,6-N-acetylglucosamine synthase-like glycosyltransferase